MGLGPGFRRTPVQEQVVGSSEFEDVLYVPAVPVDGSGLPTGESAGPSDATRLLCAAGFLRPRWGQKIAEQREAAVDSLIKRIKPDRVRRWVKDRREEAARQRAAAELEADVDKPGKQFAVPIGSDYARWVRSRILSVPWAVPSHGFDLAQVAVSCAQAARLTRRRRVLVSLSWVMGAAVGWWLHTWWAALVVPVGMWLACYIDRVSCQRQLRLVMDPSVRSQFHGQRLSRRDRKTVKRLQAQVGHTVMPYEQQLRSGGGRYHFIGAGKVWFEQPIGIDVMPPLPHRDEDDDPAGVRTSPGHPAGLTARILAGRDPGEGVLPFTPDDLLEHVRGELERPISPDRHFHPDNRQDIFGVATISSDRWPGLTKEQWAELVTLAHDGVHATGAHQAPKVARRYLCARMVSWDGELVAAVFVGFAYENHYLRVIIRPQVLNPIHPALTGARAQARRSGTLFHAQMPLLAAADAGVALWRLVKPRPARARRPVEDRKQSVVSLREVYSRRYLDDMLQYDDARRYIDMMEGRVFAAVNDFLIAHNVDVADYQNQVTTIVNNNITNNSGIVNTGHMNAVQNQPGAVGSQQSAGGA